MHTSCAGTRLEEKHEEIDTHSARQLRWMAPPPCTLMKTKITCRLVRLVVFHPACGTTERESHLCRRSGCEDRIELKPASEPGARRAAGLREGGFVSLRRLISLSVALCGFFLALLVTANSSSKLTPKVFARHGGQAEQALQLRKPSRAGDLVDSSKQR